MFPLFKKKQKIKGTVVLMCKNALDLNDIKAGPSLGAGFGLVRDVVGGVIDGATAILGRSVGLQLISATKTDRMGNGFVGDQFFLEKRIPFLPTLAARQDAFSVYFEWDNDFGIPGAFYIKNYTQGEFYLVSLTLEGTRTFFRTFFCLPEWMWQGFLGSSLFSKDLLLFALYMFIIAPNNLRMSLVRHLLSDPTGSTMIKTYLTI
uniref:PLAT domain-containing protein n=1 Tax=Medicago truncatula TaxID=3880 RepID=I3SCP1_MEDTR|nr:unknown [Medicago truncatula]